MSKKRTVRRRKKTEAGKMTFSEHFEELRSRLIVCVVSVLVLFILCYIFSDALVKVILRPYLSYREKMVADGMEDPGELGFIGPTEGFVFYLKASFLGALFLSFPVILCQMWMFISAGLYHKERRAVMRVLPFSILLFLAGILFGYFILFPIGLQFLLNFPDPDVLQAALTVSKYFDLFFILILVMGFMFQTPLVMVVTTRVGLTDAKLFSSKRRYFLLGAFVIAAMFTPPDAITQCLLAGPLVCLFELGIILCRRVERKEETEEGEEETGPDGGDERKSPPALQESGVSKDETKETAKSPEKEDSGDEAKGKAAPEDSMKSGDEGEEEPRSGAGE